MPNGILTYQRGEIRWVKLEEKISSAIGLSYDKPQKAIAHNLVMVRSLLAKTFSAEWRESGKCAISPSSK